MHKALGRFALAALAATLLASTASANTICCWGDFTFVDDLIEVDAWLFDAGNTNPTGFPPPVAVAGATATYPPPGPPIPANLLTVQELRDYYASQGCPNDTVAFRLVISGAATTLAQLKVNIDGVAAISGGGQVILTPGTYGILSGIDLTTFASTKPITVMYTAAMMTGVNIDEMRFACTPEPVSMAFLGTGFAGILLAGRRRKR